MASIRRFLVVSDDPEVVKSVGEALAAGDIESTVVSTGEDALWQIANGAYDAVLGSVTLRGMSGLEMAEEIGANHSGLPVYLIGDATRDVASTGGAVGNLQLPVTAEKIAEIVGKIKPLSGAALASGASASAEHGTSSRPKDIVLFLMGPFIAFGYILLFPVIGLGMLVYSAVGSKPAADEAKRVLSSKLPNQNFDNTTRATLNLKGTYKVSKTWDLTSGYAFERYRLSDIGYDGATYVIPPNTTQASYFTGGGGTLQNYTSQMIYMVGTFKF